jgi:hypothetical protein
MSTNNFDNETDSESYGSWDETDDETEPVGDILYDPEEESSTKYNIALCERYDKNKHGVVSGEINNHYLTCVRLKELDMDYINFVLQYNSVNVEIAECIYLPSEHCVSIIKTHWLKLIQRNWKKIYRERKLIIAMRSHPNALKHREIYGRWPNRCSIYPSLKGMLSNLSRTF